MVALSEWAVHPAVDDAAARRVDPGWRVRSTDFDFLISPAARDAVRREGIELLDYGLLQQTWARQARRE